MATARHVRVGVLALQGAFNEHVQLLRQASRILKDKNPDEFSWTFLEVRTTDQLESCDALIIPGGESTAISLVAERSGILEPLRNFVKVSRRPTWGTCAGLILLAESANRTKKGGQELIGGLDVRVNRNHFGRQIESFEANLDLPFLAEVEGKEFDTKNQPFKAVFIRAPVVERLLPQLSGQQEGEGKIAETVIAPSREARKNMSTHVRSANVEILARLPGRIAAIRDDQIKEKLESEAGDIVAVSQANVFGTSFHPELTGDPRIHVWWLEQVLISLKASDSTPQQSAT